MSYDEKMKKDGQRKKGHAAPREIGKASARTSGGKDTGRRTGKATGRDKMTASQRVHGKATKR